MKNMSSESYAEIQAFGARMAQLGVKYGFPEETYSLGQSSRSYQDRKSSLMRDLFDCKPLKRRRPSGTTVPNNAPRPDQFKQFRQVPEVPQHPPQPGLHGGVSGLWARMRESASSCQRWVESAIVGGNVPQIFCPAHSVIGVPVRVGKDIERRLLHANRIQFCRTPVGTRSAQGNSSITASAIAGQSPQTFDLCERFLLQGVESGRGVFQFVDPRTHHAPDHSAEKTMLHQLRMRMQAAHQSGSPLILGGRYRVKSLDPIKHRFVDDELLAGEASVSRLVVEDLTIPGGEKSMVITEAGLRFDDNLLRCADIKRAHDLMDSHVCDYTVAHGLTNVGDPMVVSYTGIGRNATLICYREALERLDKVRSVRDVDALLEQIVRQGRRDRGPQFIHSAAQFYELREAVLQEFGKQSLQRAALDQDNLSRTTRKVDAKFKPPEINRTAPKRACQPPVPTAAGNLPGDSIEALERQAKRQGATKRVRFAVP